MVAIQSPNWERDWAMDAPRSANMGAITEASWPNPDMSGWIAGPIARIPSATPLKIVSSCCPPSALAKNWTTWEATSPRALDMLVRSEERRVGKEWRCQGLQDGADSEQR